MLVPNTEVLLTLDATRIASEHLIDGAAPAATAVFVGAEQTPLGEARSWVLECVGRTVNVTLNGNDIADGEDAAYLTRQLEDELAPKVTS